MAYALGRLHQSSQEAFRTTLKAMDELHSSLDQSKPIGSSLVLQDLTNARQLLRSSQSSTLQEIRDKDAFVVSNIVWKHRNAYGTPQSASWPTSASTTGSSSTSEKQEAVKKVVESSLEGGRPGVLERLQRRGQVVLAQGLGLQGTALFSGIGLAQQFPPEIYMTSGAVLSLVGLGYMQLRWKAAESEFKAETEVLADQLKQDIVDTYQDQVTKTIVKPLSSVVETLDKNLGDRLSRSLEQRKVLGSIKREAQSEEDILY
ncbi:hypothetical protein BGW38_006312 [Lunasporangiospora selenospora]|uniref:Uncharacterized protein n=1 Tax=Lunasporangiospora selenospora TaxID=979761 RepID=A0A9P6FNV8_9FUNG|nr:hypothetical protein BGW38_006312 [Lunasporangiospora selenospora]